MKAEVVVEIRLEAADLDRIGTALDDFLPEGRIRSGVYEVRFRRSDPGVNELLHALEEHDIGYSLREERSFRPREIVEALALHLAPGTRVPVSGTVSSAGAFEGACPHCGRGGEQVGDLVLEQLPHPAVGFAMTAEGQMLVTEPVARAMIAGRISGCLLRSTRDRDGRVQNVFQVLPTHTLPPLRIPPTRIQKDPGATCATCGSGGLSVTSLLYYDVTRDELCDLNIAREGFGDASGTHGGVVVSQKLFRLLYECGARGVSVEPVVLV